MNFTQKQNLMIQKLKENGADLIWLTSELLRLEGIGFKDSYHYTRILDKYKKTLLIHEELLMSDEFDIDFIIEVKDLICSNLDKIDVKEVSLAIRIIGELENKLSDNLLLRYDRDILIVMFCLLDNYLADNRLNDYLKRNLITMKYVLALRSFEITKECLNRGFDFRDNVYVFPEIISFVNEKNNCLEYSLQEYCKRFFVNYGNELLSYKNEDYYNLNENCYAIQSFFLVESIILFLDDDLTWDYCEENLNVDENNTTSIELLKKALKSKPETRKRVNFVSFSQ